MKYENLYAHMNNYYGTEIVKDKCLFLSIINPK